MEATYKENTVAYCNRIGIRDTIELCKLRYKSTKNTDEILSAAILKGLYLAIGGRKGIVISQQFDAIVQGAKLAFTYMYKLDTCKNILTPIKWLSSTINEYNQKIILDRLSPNDYYHTNEDIALLLSEIVFQCGTEDIAVNRQNTQLITINILNQFGRR